MCRLDGKIDFQVYLEGLNPSFDVKFMLPGVEEVQPPAGMLNAQTLVKVAAL